MEAMRKSWTDERLDHGFDRVDADLRVIRGEVSSLRVDTNARFDRLEDRFDRFEDRFDGWQRAMLQVGGGVIVALLGIIATQL